MNAKQLSCLTSYLSMSENRSLFNALEFLDNWVGECSGGGLDLTEDNFTALKAAIVTLRSIPRTWGIRFSGLMRQRADQLGTEYCIVAIRLTMRGPCDRTPITIVLS
jgi:hypothetical protein